MKSYVKLYDTVTITPSSVDQFVSASIKDNVYAPVGKSLRVDIVATHAGRLTRNHGLYLPQKMKDGIGTFLENFGKPILTHHNSHEDPVGRIVDAKYIDTSMNFARDSVIDGIIRDLCKPNISFIQSVSLIDKLSTDSALLRDPSYPGLGYALITADITDPEAIQKVLDKRFLTVSVGVSTDRAVCSICKQDLVADGFCEHVPGKLYEDELAYLICGNLMYEEASFVNVPADALARVVMVHNGAIHDSIVVEESKQICNVNASFYFTDSCPDTGGVNMEKNIQDAWKEASDLLALEESSKEDKLKSLRDFIEEFKDQEDACLQEAKDKLAELEKPEEPATNVQDNTQESDPEPDESDKHYEDMIEFALNLGLLDEAFFEPTEGQLLDKKLSAGERKKMAKSTFCKPGERKYPVNDCNHAKVAMAYAKKNNESSAVISCIRRKAKALGCPFNGKKDNFDEFEADLDVILKELMDGTQQAQEQVNDNTQGQDTSAEPECESCKELEDKVKALRQELKDIYAEFDSLQQDHIDTLQTMKLQLADNAVMMDQLNGKTIEDLEKAKTDFAAMSLEDLVKQTGTLRDSLNVGAIVAKLNDGMSNVPTGDIEDPSLSSQNEQDPTKLEDPFKGYKDKYLKILNKQGRIKAGEYFDSLLVAGLVPNNFDPEGGNA